MIRRWNHGHSLAAGGLIALLLVTHLLWTLTAVFAAGVLVGWFARQLRTAGRKVSGAVDARTRLERERWKEVQARRRAHVAKRGASRAALDRAYRRGVIEGRLDGSK